MIKENIKKFIELAYSPLKWYDKQIELSYREPFMKCAIIFAVLGLVLRLHFDFPYWALYISLFSCIQITVLKAIHYYVKILTEINAILASQKSLRYASSFYYRYIYKNPLYFFLPCLIVFVFSWGGLTLFRAITINPLLIWIMILFSVTVYISIVGYVQYMFLAFFLFKLSLKDYKFFGVRHSLNEYIPADINWLQKLTKLVHVYRIVFFSIGSLYIIAFGCFCYLPNFNVEHNSPFFFTLWIIIFFAIVLIFPIISILEYSWIKKIVIKIKNSYIFDAEKEIKYIKFNSTKKNELKLQIYFLQNIYTQLIAESRDYPNDSIINVVCSSCLAVFNVVAIFLTLIQGIPIVLGDLLQSF